MQNLIKCDSRKYVIKLHFFCPFLFRKFYFPIPFLEFNLTDRKKIQMTENIHLY